MSENKRSRQDTQNHSNQGTGSKRQRRRWSRKHLYLVLDDWEKGYSIHKMDPDTFDSDSDDDEAAARRLPEPPALRLEPPAASQVQPHTDMSFAAMGTKLFALMNHRCGLVYDAGTAVLSLGAHAPADMVCGYGDTLAAAGDDVLYALSYRFFDREHPHCFGAMSWGPTSPDARQHPTEGWSWKPLPPPPFRTNTQAHALHPDGRTIFVTASEDRCHTNTYSFDTVDSAWRRHGNWALPFLGHGHFDAELDAWVGLDMNGHVCACQVISPSFRCFYPDCKVTRESIFSKERHIKATLTSMGGGKYCLVECVGSANAERVYGAYDGCVIRLTVFGLKYNHKGELHIRDHRSTSSFLVSRYKYHFVPKAFWM
ncbi:unnamed protein product [Urochloa humidicola]